MKAVIWTYTPDIAAGMPIVTAALVGFVQLDIAVPAEDGKECGEHDSNVSFF